MKVTAACHHCYAEAFAKRVGQRVWGPKADRRFFGDKHWAEPLRWNARAQQAGCRYRVFCASMADVFEDRRDLDLHRSRLWRLIADTPDLDWLLLTKRPELISGLTPWGKRWPRNVWIGTAIEDQEAAEQRLPHLTAIPAAVRFISAEPLFGLLDLSPWIDRLDWVIAGGESGGGPRPSVPAHFADLRDQCLAADVSFFFKQSGEFAAASSAYVGKRATTVVAGGTLMVRATKKVAGRLLDGVVWDQIPRLDADRIIV